MSIIRVEKNNNYVVMNRTGLNDERLSWKAKGILAYMLSMPDDWIFYVEELIKHSTDGERSFRSGMKELVIHGYVIRKPVYENGKISSWDTIVREAPKKFDPNDLHKLLVQNEDVEDENVENEGLLSTDLKLNTDIKLNNNNICVYSHEFERFWSLYPRKLDKKKAYKHFKTALKTHSLETIIDGTEKYARFTKDSKTETQFIKHAATFLNSESFLNEYEVSNEVNKRRYADQYAIDDLPF